MSSIGPLAGQTANYKFSLVNFDWTTWHDYEHENWNLVDSLFAISVGGANVKGYWINDTSMAVDDVRVDPDDQSRWKCLIAHTSAATGTFAEDRTANPTYWEVYAPYGDAFLANGQTFTGENKFSGKTFIDDAIVGDITVAAEPADTPLHIIGQGGQVAGASYLDGVAILVERAGGGASINLVCDDDKTANILIGTASNNFDASMQYSAPNREVGLHAPNAGGRQISWGTNVTGGVQIGVPTGGYKGAGVLNAEDVQINGVTVCWVLEKHLTGTVDVARWDAMVPNTVREILDAEGNVSSTVDVVNESKGVRKFLARFDAGEDPMDFYWQRQHVTDKGHLSPFQNPTNADGSRSLTRIDESLTEMVELLYVYIDKLHARIDSLEEFAVGKGYRP